MTTNIPNTARKLKVLEIALLVGLALFLASGALALQAGDQLSEKVVRLHVLANSDSEEDQALKLQVRDRIGGALCSRRCVPRLLAAYPRRPWLRG